MVTPHFGYYPQTRQYFIDRKLRCGGGVVFINYCPWCGKKLPAPLLDQLEEILWNECDEGFEVYKHFQDDPNWNFPKEFQTDEWWKKRGL